MQNSPQPHRPHLRFYVFMVTLVVGGLFFLLYLNDGDGSDTSLISAITGYSSADTEENADTDPTGELDQEFDDLSTTITVNGDQLELKNLKEVDLSIEDFAGKVILGSTEFSLAGTARRIEVNDIAFSSEKEVPILFQGLNYQHLHIADLELKDLELDRGNGELTVGEKLRYTLDDEELKILYFNGGLTIDKEARNSTSLAMEGEVKGLYIGGELLTFTLR